MAEDSKPPHAQHDRDIGKEFERLEKAVEKTERKVKRIHKMPKRGRSKR